MVRLLRFIHHFTHFISRQPHQPDHFVHVYEKEEDQIRRREEWRRGCAKVEERKVPLNPGELGQHTNLSAGSLPAS